MGRIAGERYRLVNDTFLVTVLFYIGASMLLSGWLARTDSLVLRLLVSQVILVIPTLGYLVLRGEPLRITIRWRMLKLSRIALLILFTVSIMPFMSFVNALSLTVTTNQAVADLYGLAQMSLPIALLCTAVVPAVLEETVYRGVFYQEYRQISVGRGILLSGLLFGLMHLNLNQFSYAFAMGCIFALVVEVTDSILSTMIIHSVINASSTFVTYFMAEEEILTEMSQTELLTMTEVWQVGAAAVVPTLLAVVLLIWLSHLEGRSHVWGELFRRKSTEKEERKMLLTAPLLAGILICVGYIVLYECSIR